MPLFSPAEISANPYKKRPASFCGDRGAVRGTTLISYSEAAVPVILKKPTLSFC